MCALFVKSEIITKFASDSSIDIRTKEHKAFVLEYFCSYVFMS